LSGRFVITVKDIEKIESTPADPTAQVLFDKLGDQLIQHPLVVAGWSASEPYLIELFDDYGALWKEDDLRLTVPLPAWVGGQRLNHLRGLKSLADLIRRDMPSVSSLRIFPVIIAPGQPVSERTILRLKQGLAKELPHSHFAQVRNIGLVQATNLNRRHIHDQRT
jgi:hypothetical protein